MRTDATMLRAGAAALMLAATAACGSTVQGSTAGTIGATQAGLAGPNVASSSATNGQGLTAPGATGSQQAGTNTSTGGATTGNGNGTTGGAVGPGSANASSSGPIRIGIMYTNNDAAATAGVDNGTSFTAGGVAKALVASWNSSGGFAGRKIQPYYQVINSSSNDFEGDLNASCAAFTQDDHVSAVINYVGLYEESYQACLAKAQTPVVSDLGPDTQDARQFPLMVTPDDLLADTRVTQVVLKLKASGWLTPSNRIGVVIEGCPIDQRIFTNTLKPVIARAGLTLAATAQPHCFSAISDLGTISGDMGNAVVSFRTANVDRVMFVSIGEEGTLGYEFMLAASQQRWYPGYAMSSMSYATTLALQSGVSQQELENSRGVGWNPVTDTADLKQAPPDAAAKQCLARLAQQGLHPATNNDHFYAYAICDQFAFLAQLLQATHGNAAPSAYLQGAKAVASAGFQSALTVNGSITGWDGGRLSPGAYRYFAYDTNKGEFLYTGNPANF